MTHAKVRRSGRISKEIPILLLGSDADGTVFSEQTRTVVLSRHGAGIVSTHKLLAEQELTIRTMDTGREAEIRIVGEIGAQGEAHTYGVAFVDRVLDFWRASFPVATANENEAAAISLSCIGCQAFVTLEYGEFEADVCAIHGGLVRYCAVCGLSTMWRLRRDGNAARILSKTKTAMGSATGSAVAVAEPSDEAAPAGTTPDRRGSIRDRRDRTRAKVNFYACIRTEAFGDDVVRCIDMSRGGLSFKTQNFYGRGDLIRIAVPFSLEARDAAAIFVPAKIAYVQEVGQNLYRCGVAYLPNGESYSHR